VKKIKKEKIWGKLFEVTVFLKGLEGAIEIISGALLVYTAKTDQLTKILLKITEHELSQDPSDFLANKLVGIVENMHPGVSFGMLYLLFHGIIKTFLAIMLLQRKLWAYPLAIYVFFTLAVLLLIKFLTGLAPLYLVLSIFDWAIGVLTIHDYKRLKARMAEAK